MRVLPRIDTDFDKGCAFGCLKIENLNDLETWFLKTAYRRKNGFTLVLELYSGLSYITCEDFRIDDDFERFKQFLENTKTIFQKIKERYKEENESN